MISGIAAIGARSSAGMVVALGRSLGNEGLKRPSKDEKSILQGYHSTLAAYNEGAIGPGHCDEDPIARANNTDE